MDLDITFDEEALLKTCNYAASYVFHTDPFSKEDIHKFLQCVLKMGFLLRAYPDQTDGLGASVCITTSTKVPERPKRSASPSLGFRTTLGMIPSVQKFFLDEEVIHKGADARLTASFSGFPVIARDIYHRASNRIDLRDYDPSELHTMTLDDMPLLINDPILKMWALYRLEHE